MNARSISVLPSLCAIGLLVACTGQRAQNSEKQSVAAAAVKALPFIEDDFERAVTDGDQRKVPLFVEEWAAW
jgi:hypothetical protein